MELIKVVWELIEVYNMHILVICCGCSANLLLAAIFIYAPFALSGQISSEEEQGDYNEDSYREIND